MANMNFTMDLQKGALLCWAAVSVSVDKSMTPRQAPGVDQCELAAAVLPAPGCHPNASGQCTCDKEAGLVEGLIGVNRPSTGAIPPQSLAVINQQLSHQRPVCIRIEWADPGEGGATSHFVVIYKTSATKVWTIEPGHGTTHKFTYQAFHDGTELYESDGTWKNTYLLQP